MQTPLPNRFQRTDRQARWGGGCWCMWLSAIQLLSKLQKKHFEMRCKWTVELLKWTQGRLHTTGILKVIFILLLFSSVWDHFICWNLLKNHQIIRLFLNWQLAKKNTSKTVWLYPLFVFPWFIILLCFLIHLMHFLNNWNCCFLFAMCERRHDPPAPFPPLSPLPKPPFCSSTGYWKQEGEGPALSDCCLTYNQQLFTRRTATSLISWLEKKKKQTKKVTWLKEVTDRQHALYQSAQSIAPHLSGSWEPGMLSDALGWVCTAIMWSQVCRNEAVFSYFYCSRWL